MPYYGVEQWKVVVSRRKKKELPYASYAWTTPGLCLALGGMRRRTQRTPLTGLYAFPFETAPSRPPTAQTTSEHLRLLASFRRTAASTQEASFLM
jgi:hypothetical protein